MPLDYTDRVLDEFPRGKAWPRTVGGWLWKLASGLGIEFGRVDDRGEDLLREMDPRTAVETLPDWERITGLPDPTDENPPTSDADRQAAVTSVWISRGAGVGGPGPASLRALVVSLGYAEEDVRIRRFHLGPFEAGVSACGEPLGASSDRQITEVIARSGSLDSTVRARVSRYALFGTPLTFSFPLLFWSDATMLRNVSTFTEPVNMSVNSVTPGTFPYAFIEGGDVDIESTPVP